MAKLAAGADVLVHNYRPEPAARLGMDYEAFARENPRLIYVATYGFHADGPMGATAAYDDIIQAASGLAMLQDMVTGEPRCVPTVIADKIGSNAVVSAVLAALYERERSGRGQAIEVPMFETVVAFLMIEHLYGHPKIDELIAIGATRDGRSV